jgi:undecaprenyl-diphosphatase
MSPPVVVLLCGLVAAVVSFGLSAARSITVDVVDPAAEERAIRVALRRHPRLGRFLRERMDRHTAGGFLLTASLLVLFVVSLLVGSLLELIGETSWLANADRSVAEWGSRHQTSAAVTVLEWVTQLGSSLVVVVALLVTAGIDFARRRSTEVFLFVAAVGVGELLLSNVLKVIIGRERPAVLHLVAAGGYSFPSGHTVAAAAAWSAIALLLGRGRPRLVRALLAGGAALIAISVAVSRALLGVHWLSDVIAGLAIGWGWFMIVAIAFGGRAQRLGDPVVTS